MVIKAYPPRNGIAWLETLLAIVAIALVIQVWPQVGSAILIVIDVRNWPRTAWFVANFVVVIVLIGIRVGPDTIKDWRERKLNTEVERDRCTKALSKKREREAIERIEESRGRRIY